jgi:hypothetical protein
MPQLVAKGYSKREGPVASLESIRLLVALAAQFQRNIRHVNVKFALLNEDLVEEATLLFC